MLRPICCAAAFVLVFQSSVRADSPLDQATVDIQELRPGTPLERELAAAQPHTYQVKLAPGQFLRVEVQQKSIDVAVGLIGPDGAQLVDVDLTTVVDGREPISYEASTGGQYRLVIRTARKDAPRGTYQLAAETHGKSTEARRTRLAAERLLAEVTALRRQGKPTDPQVVEKLDRALSIWRELGDAYWQADAFNRLGFTYAAAREHDKAREAYEQAVRLYREVNTRGGEGNALYNLGNAYNSLARYEKALEYYEQALPILREVKNRSTEGAALHNAGNAYAGMNRRTKSVEYVEQALQIHREVKNRAGEAGALSSLGNAYLNLARYEKGIEVPRASAPNLP